MESNKRLRRENLSDIDIGEVFAENHRFKLGHKVFHLSIIDYLQEWNLNKKLERYAKIYFKNADPSGLSAIAPAEYQRRFMRFMKDIVFPFK